MNRICLTTAMIVCLTASFASAGGVKGTIKLKGKAPAPVIQVKKGDPSVKDAAVCAAQDLMKNDFVVNQDNSGIANVFLYMKAAPAWCEVRTFREEDIDLRSKELPLCSARPNRADRSGSRSHFF